MNDYDELFVDEVMRDCWARKAHVIEQFGGVDGYYKHIDEDRPRLEKEGWKFVTVEEVRQRSIRPLGG